MTAVRIVIERMVDPSSPGWVACTLVDADGRAWSIVEKVPVVSQTDLHPNSAYPIRASIACTVIAREAVDGRERVTIDTSAPWGIAATDGRTRFVVDADALDAW